MSFDIIILKPTNLSENDLSNVEDVLDIGCHEAVITFLELVFPGCAQGAFSDGERYSLEWTCPYQIGHQLPVKLMLLPSA